ncbi:hypothetical protein KIH23_02190 [Flavobacterium sp. CYK-55]|uniref:hypothetical protein n=1 Tax=Flavobacterium sp. CYK-55 TaxID=2835529 RepID=UPI001BCAB342|nr:hypothetical protein [Flavobacterium sp. CYK-55]MBS7786093.1 hypothetical protein [Flavobacterium sp. CYK-55]
MKSKLYILGILLCAMSLQAQQKQVITAVDKTKNKIGAEFKLTLKTTVDTAARVVFPEPKTLGALEVINSYKIDTVAQGNRYELIKKYGLTQFDSGRYTLPSIKVLINNKPFYSDSLRVEVQNVQVDTLRQKMYDIKPIAAAPSDYSWMWKWFIALVLLAVSVWFAYRYIKNRQKKKIEEEVYKTPIEKATQLLNTLEQKQLWQKGEVKTYYSELTNIARNYIEEAIEIPAMESTTAELIEALQRASIKKKMTLTPETVENLQRVLQQADLVKFAKSKPLDFEIAEDRKKIEKTIVTLDQSIPAVEVVEEESLLNEMQRQEQIKQQLRKNRKKRIVFVSVFVISFAIAAFTGAVLVKGYTFVKDTIIGNNSKELLEGEWVSSEYGNPSVAIQTPQVLTRIDLSKTLPPEGMALIKEMQSFIFGSLNAKFMVMVSTTKLKQSTEIDLTKASESSMQYYQAMGAQNMIVKQEEFSTKEGLKGLRSYGTFSMIDKLTKSSGKFYYEVLLFNQEGGLQQITMVYEEGDQYAGQISERILNSVELRKMQP